jgi:regulator of sigma E protease
VIAGQLFLSLSILIVLHELGHFTPAKLFNTRVEKFYLFFDPGFSLFKYQRGETEYGIGWLPLGGYVKISGMIDESMDREQMAQPPQPWEFRSKPAWQRLIIMLGGVTVNFILGFLLFGMVLWVWGEEYLPTKNLTHGIYADSLGMEMGLRDGDAVLSVGGKPFDKFNDGIVKQEIIFNDARNIAVNRDGRTVDLPIDPKFVGELTSYKNKNEGLFGPRIPFVVVSVSDEDKYPAKRAGIKVNDQIIAVNDTPTPFYHEYIKAARDNKGKPITVDLIRTDSVSNKKDTLNIPLTLTETGQMGVLATNPYDYFGSEREDFTLGQALPEGTKRGLAFLGNQINAFGKMFKGDIKVTESLGGFGAIGGMFGSEWIWERFWKMTAILSLILAFMNLLPIPALDGGHVMFLLFEVVTGRKPSDKFMEYATIAGFVIVIGLVLLANGLDIWRWLQG